MDKMSANHSNNDIKSFMGAETVQVPSVNDALVKIEVI